MRRAISQEIDSHEGDRAGYLRHGWEVRFLSPGAPGASGASARPPPPVSPPWEPGSADLQGERDYSGQRAYSQSKLANVMFTYELARRLEGTGVTATVLHPGVLRTSFGAEDPVAHFALMIRVARPFMKTPAQGAATPVYLASSPPGGGRHRPILRQGQAQGLKPGVVRHRGRGAAVAGQRRPGRPGRALANGAGRPGQLRLGKPGPCASPASSGRWIGGLSMTAVIT